MLSAADVTGLLALPPSALKEEGEHWDDSNSVDLDEATRLADQMIKDGASAIGLCGTTGECATLLWDEKVALLRRGHRGGRRPCAGLVRDDRARNARGRPPDARGQGPRRRRGVRRPAALADADHGPTRSASSPTSVRPSPICR